MYRSIGQVVQILQGEGLAATQSALNYAILAGRIPKPATDSLGNRQWSKADIAAARKYLKQPRRRGRPRTVNTGGPRR